MDRLWPRGVSKDDLKVEEWLKDTSPTDELRTWFNHDDAKWDTFRTKYAKELEKRQPSGLTTLRQAAREGDVTLVHAARDEDHNNAVALKEILESET